MASLLKAGLPLSTALNTLRERDAHPVWKGIIGGLRARLEDGQTFSQSLAAFPDPVYTNLVHAGEEGGNLVEVLNRLEALGEQREEILSRARMAMVSSVYPAVLLGLGVIVVFVMMAFVVPAFTTVFDETGQALTPAQDDTHCHQLLPGPVLVAREHACPTCVPSRERCPALFWGCPSSGVLYWCRIL